MKGVIKIRVNGHNITVKGYTNQADTMSQAATVDALMNTFGMTGELRKVVCDALIYVDERRAEKENEDKEVVE